MQGRSIERRSTAPGRVAVLAAAVLASGCLADPVTPVDAAPIAPVDADPIAPDAGPDGYAVRGSATGVLGPVALALRIDGGFELLAVTQEGTFAFDTQLEDGASYTVDLVNPDLPCTLRNETGVITGADTAIELTCTGASLVSVAVSGIAPAVTIVPGTTDSAVDLPLSQTSATLTATVATAGDTLAIAGIPVASGEPSAEIPLSLGDNIVDIVVENALGWQRTYRLTLRRAPQLAQHAYAKASNPDASDQFGYHVALSGDTLAVGAAYESSAAQGVGGNQANNWALESGAVYVFRRIGSAWQQEAYLKASNTGASDQLGTSMTLSGDTIAVGARLEDSATQGVGGNQADNSATDSEAVYVFRRIGSAWQQEAHLKASNTDAYDDFGHSVALSGDILAVGANDEDSAARGVGGNQDDNSATGSGGLRVPPHGHGLAAEGLRQGVQHRRHRPLRLERGALGRHRRDRGPLSRPAQRRAWTATRTTTPHRIAARSTSSTDSARSSPGRRRARSRECRNVRPARAHRRGAGAGSARKTCASATSWCGTCFARTCKHARPVPYLPRTYAHRRGAGAGPARKTCASATSRCETSM